MFNIVLINPEIPQNTGNIARSVISQKCRLHLVKPIGFNIDDASLRRAGLDYWQFIDLKIWDSVDVFFSANDMERMHFFPKKGRVRYDQAEYSKGDFL
ncbi:MAG TPA: TrmH family RNA methyltransferase, partial [bacterium]|nr:TrmH family RNA methyltransferase [bacterium]